MSASKAVAYVLSLASSLVVDVLPSGDTDSSVFTSEIAGVNSSSKVRLESIPPGGDFLRPLKVLKDPQALLTSFTISSLNAVTLSRLLITLPSFKNTPVTVHIALSSEEILSHALILRSSVPYFLVSGTAQQAHDHAIVASKLALAKKQVVVHAFSDKNGPEDVESISDASLYSLLSSSDPEPILTNGWAHPQGNGDARPFVDGHHANGNAVKHRNSDSFSRDLDDSPEAALYRGYAATILSTQVSTKRTLRSWTYFGPPNPETLIISLGMFFFSI